MERLIVALVFAVAALAVAMWVQRRRADAPTQPRTWEAPAQLDRGDFERPDAPWLVCVFTSSTCATCADVAAKAEVLVSPQVAVQDVDAVTRRDLHERYGIEAVPIVAIADDEGVVRASFVGPVSATHLWAAVARLRDPGSVPQDCGGDDI